MFAKEMCIVEQVGNFFVKLNCKDIDNIRSLIVNWQNRHINNKEKYMMCAGKYDKNGWTLVFRARTFEEAEELANINPFLDRKRVVN